MENEENKQQEENKQVEDSQALAIYTGPETKEPIEKRELTEEEKMLRDE